MKRNWRTFLPPKTFKEGGKWQKTIFPPFSDQSPPETILRGLLVKGKTVQKFRMIHPCLSGPDSIFPLLRVSAMAIVNFTQEQFEKALPCKEGKPLWTCAGVDAKTADSLPCPALPPAALRNSHLVKSQIVRRIHGSSGQGFNSCRHRSLRGGWMEAIRR